MLFFRLWNQVLYWNAISLYLKIIKRFNNLHFLLNWIFCLRLKLVLMFQDLDNLYGKLWKRSVQVYAARCHIFVPHLNCVVCLQVLATTFFGSANILGSLLRDKVSCCCFERSSFEENILVQHCKELRIMYEL